MHSSWWWSLGSSKGAWKKCICEGKVNVYVYYSCSSSRREHGQANERERKVDSDVRRGYLSVDTSM